MTLTSGEKIAALLLKEEPAPRLALNYSNALELLVAVMLSAQCTDARVNEVTKALFKKYKVAADYANTSVATLEKAVRPTGFYKNKARAIKHCCEKLVRDFEGEVPRDLDSLMSLPGIGRKSANMVLGNAFGVPAIAVDTHVLRVSNRLGIVHSGVAERVERELMQQVPKNQWTSFANAMILHGREICTARKPRCSSCVLYEACGWPEKASASVF
jgi:endonuclease-3